MAGTARTFTFASTGAPDVLTLAEGPLAAPGEGQVQIAQEAIGINYIDVYHRSGTYPLPLPSGLGVEGAGIIEVLGPGVTGFEPGDRVVYAGGPPGAYATARNVPAARVVKLPDDISMEDAASLFFKGLTVEYLIRRCFKVQAGDKVLFHAAAGGIGLIACQWLKALGASVIGTVGSDEKAALAKDNGCEHPIVYTRENFVERVKAITGGEGVPVVYDSIGKDTVMGSLDCLRPRGMLVSFGTASGAVPPLDLGILGAKGSLMVTRPSIAHYTARRDELEAGAAAVFEMIRTGTIKAVGLKRYPLAQAEQAHAELEGRKTTGSLILIP
ncbi:MAG: quinone oxidoreductase [Proteobacteria bacterium]|nr:quinone oxidoreductase [Pseudomonadota bacterium]